eukprot:jgi/Mesvir1/16423/Mv25730-RA.1
MDRPAPGTSTKSPPLPTFTNVPKLDLKTQPHQIFSTLSLIFQITLSREEHSRWKIPYSVLVPLYLQSCVSSDLMTLIYCESFSAHAYPTSVAELFRRLETNLVPPDVDWQTRLNFGTVTQGIKTCREYMVAFDGQMVHIPDLAGSEVRARFLQGLNKPLLNDPPPSCEMVLEFVAQGNRGLFHDSLLQRTIEKCRIRKHAKQSQLARLP